MTSIAGEIGLDGLLTGKLGLVMMCRFAEEVVPGSNSVVETLTRVVESLTQRLPQQHEYAAGGCAESMQQLGLLHGSSIAAYLLWRHCLVGKQVCGVGAAWSLAELPAAVLPYVLLLAVS